VGTGVVPGGACGDGGDGGVLEQDEGDDYGTMSVVVDPV
jgi:hypothetical protein